MKESYQTPEMDIVIVPEQIVTYSTGGMVNCPYDTCGEDF